jgi:TrmH family RNA methyltransferase
LTPLGARHHEVRRLRALLRERGARVDEDAFVLEGPRVLAGALDRGARIDELYLGPGADRAFAALAARARAAGASVRELREGVLEKVGTTRTPQPVFAVARRRGVSIDRLPTSGHLIVTVDVADPGNLGTIIRTAEASGADGVVATGPNSVDLHHPKVVRSTAGAIFGIQVAEREDAPAALDDVARGGRRRLATRALDAPPYDETDLAHSCALVLGNEAHGIPSELEGHLDGAVSVPMTGGAESLNVAMAATVLCFEAARQRRAAAVAR